MLEGETIFRLLAFYRPSPTASSCFLRFNCRVRNLWCHCCGGFSSLKLTHALGCTKWSPTSITLCCDRRCLWSCSHKHFMFLHMNGNWCTSSFVFAPHPHKHLSLGVHRRPKYHWLGGNKPNYKHNQRPPHINIAMERFSWRAEPTLVVLVSWGQRWPISMSPPTPW